METTESTRPVIGVRLTLATAAGGRKTAIALNVSPGTFGNYRPDWVLPGWTQDRLSGAWILGGSSEFLDPGASATAVIMPYADYYLREWSEIVPGDELQMREGSMRTGHAQVLWTESFPHSGPSPEQTQELLLRVSAAPNP